MENLGSLLAYLCFVSFAFGAVVYLVAFITMLYESPFDKDRQNLDTMMMFYGNRAIQLIQLSVILAVAGACIAENNMDLKHQIGLLALGYTAAWFFWVPLKLVLFMASGGVTRIFNKLFPQSPA